MMQKSTTADWREEFVEWLAPFLDALGRAEQRQWAPTYMEGLLGPGERKSVEPMAERVCPGDVQQLHHFVSTSPWATAPLEQVLATTADSLVGGSEAVLIIDDTALVKQGRHSVGVARQYCGVLGKMANCQVLVSLTLAQREVPVPLALRLYLSEAWASDLERRREAKVPSEVTFRTKGEIAIEELDRIMAAGVRFGSVTADTGYGSSVEFRAELTRRALTWAVGVTCAQQVYPADVTLLPPPPRREGERGPSHKNPVPSVKSVAAEALIEALGPRAFRRTTWRMGTKGPLSVSFAAVRVRVADGAPISRSRHLPGEEAWLLCEWRATGERKYYLTNHPPQTSRTELLRAIKARWACEQVHQQLKEELGLDHFEGRSWLGLHHHALLSMIAFAFLQHRRLEAARAAAETTCRTRGRKRHRAGEKTRERESREAKDHEDHEDHHNARPASTTVAADSASCTTRYPAHRRTSPMSLLSCPNPAVAA